MLIRVTKARHADRPHTLTCIRDNGTTTGQSSSGFFILHDLTHYAVEVGLELTTGFYGLIAEGWNFGSFDEREPGSLKNRKLPLEAKWAEMLVGSYDIERATGPVPDEDRLESLHEACLEKGMMEPDITVDDLARVRTLRDDLVRQWHALPPGDYLELLFPTSAADRAQLS